MTKTIEPRDVRIQTDAAELQGWLNREPLAATFYNALSSLFPLGERFFMDSVRAFRGVTEGRLAAEVAAFMQQEALHTREHLAFNRQVATAGFDMAPLDAAIRRELDGARKRSPLAQLALTAALEHVTAALAHELLREPAHLRGAPAETRRLWRWHAMEEIEHKAVAFDTFLVAAAGWSPLRRWLFRSALMGEAAFRLCRVTLKTMGELDRQGRARVARPAPVARFLFARPGLLRDMIPELLRFFAPGFHPWDRDDRALAATGAPDAELKSA